MKRSSGFTIVELLIVIVVIAILAAISIVAYSGIQQRSRNTARLSAIQGYVKLLSMYATQNNGTYPTFTNGACLGTGYTSASCTNSTLTQTTPSSATEQSTFNTQLATVGTLPDYPKLNSSGSGTGTETGAFIYTYGVTNETPSRGYRIFYLLDGPNQDCGQSRIARNTDGSAAGSGAFTIAVNLGYKNSAYTTDRTQCILSLLNPNEF